MRALSFFAAALFFVSPSFAARPPEVVGPRSGRWAHEAPRSLAPDPDVIWGRLDNGFRYALLPSKGQPGRVALQLIVLSGSLDEKPDELGIAHYIEHLCFGGTKHFKREEMTDLFERLGIEYGSDVNANTSWDATTFRLDFRENTPALLHEGLQLFRDFGDSVTFPPETIERERRVVLAELRLRNTLSGKQQQASLPVIFPGLRFTERLPGGSEEMIRHFTREQFLEFYRRCYRPDLMVLVGVGDFEPGAMTAEVRRLFGDLIRPAEPVPVRDEGRLDVRGLRAGIFRIGGMMSTAVDAACVSPLPPGPDTREAHVLAQQRQFVSELFSQRLHTDMSSGMMGDADYNELMGYGLATASTQVPAAHWADGVRGLDEMVRLTLERGLDPSEVDTYRHRQLQLAAHMLDQLPVLDPGTLCDALVDSIESNTVFEGFRQRFTWMREWLERFTPADAQRVFRGIWAPATMAFHLSGGVDAGAGGQAVITNELTPQKILQEVQKGRRNGFDAVLARVHRDTPFALPKLGTPTNVVETRELPAIDAKLMRFGNNVRLNFVPSKQEPGLVRAIVRVGNGLLDMPGRKPALKEFALSSLLASGSVHFRPEVMNSLIDERLLEFSFDLADRDAFTFRGLMAPEQLEVFLGIVADILHAPIFNSYAYEDEKIRAAVGRMSSTMGIGDGMRELTDYLFKGDARFAWGQPLDYVAMSIIDVRNWMQPSIARGYVEATIVGDIPEQSVVRTMSRTLGAIGQRAATKVLARPARPVEITARPGLTRIEFVGEQNTGLVVGTWPVTEPLHVRDQAALEILAKILEIRVRTEVREKLGLAYSPSAEFRPYDGFPAFAIFRAQVDCAPTDAKKVAPVVTDVAAQLARDGVTAGEFVGARGIEKSQLKAAFRDNGFIADNLMRAQERPKELEEILALRGDVMDSITREEVNKWAAKVLPASNCRTAEIVPKAFVGMF